MRLVYQYLFPALWLSWGACWWALSFNGKPVKRRESLLSRAAHIGPLAAAVLLLWIPRFPVPFLGERFLPFSASLFWASVAITEAGFLFAIWARLHLGRNWSAMVTIKEGHELVTSGPYAIVRHPIYTGLLLAFIGSALARAEWRGVLAVALAFGALWRKLRMEENWMRGQFGPRYLEYCRRVAALVPFLL